MPEREGTPEDFARMAAQLRGQDLLTKQEQHRKLVEASTRPNWSPSQTSRPRSSWRGCSHRSRVMPS